MGMKTNKKQGEENMNGRKIVCTSFNKPSMFKNSSALKEPNKMNDEFENKASG